MEKQEEKTDASKEAVREVAGRMLEVIRHMIDANSLSASNVRNVTGALRDVRELCGESEGKTIVIRLEGDDEWAK